MATAQAVHQLRSWSTTEVKHGLLHLPSLQGKVTARPVRRHSSGVARATVKVDSPSSLPIKKRPPPQTKRRSQYDITTFTTWLVRQEQEGTIDGELAIVLSSISLACKQIASLVQRAGISNMTGLQGVANIQGEEQKKLDVISNEVRTWCRKLIRVWYSRRLLMAGSTGFRV